MSVETTLSNMLSTAKLYETFRKSPREKLFEGNKILEPIFVFINFVQTSERVTFCYRLSLARIRRVKYLTIYDFHQVNLESVKNVVLSQVKTFDRLFSINPCLLSVSIIY